MRARPVEFWAKLQSATDLMAAAGEEPLSAASATFLNAACGAPAARDDREWWP
jgi:hypothetical protein